MADKKHPDQKINGKRYIYDRGRYKEIDKVGSVSKQKGTMLSRLFKTKAKAYNQAPQGIGAAIGSRAQMIAEIDKEIQKQYER